MMPASCYQCADFDRRVRQRCGWCISHDHENCIGSVEIGADPKRGRPKKDDYRPRLKSQIPGQWTCGCTCGYASQKASAAEERLTG